MCFPELGRAPSFHFGGSAEFTAGNYNEVGGSAKVLLPVLGGGPRTFGATLRAKF